MYIVYHEIGRLIITQSEYPTEVCTASCTAYIPHRWEPTQLIIIQIRIWRSGTTSQYILNGGAGGCCEELEKKKNESTICHRVHWVGIFHGVDAELLGFLGLTEDPAPDGECWEGVRSRTAGLEALCTTVVAMDTER